MTTANQSRSESICESPRIRLLSAIVLAVSTLATGGLHAQTHHAFRSGPTVSPAEHLSYGASEPAKLVTVAQDGDHGWWHSQIGMPTRSDSRLVGLTLEDAILRTLEHSRQVKVFSDLPLIRETAIHEAVAAFDWTKFLETQWLDSSEPIGSSLTAGAGIDRFNDHHFTFGGGLRKKTALGGQVEIAQRFGLQDTNSQFFIPNDQGSSRLVLSFTQPLLRGGGRAYNRSLICIATIDRDSAQDEFSRQLQSHLLEVTRTYWALYLERAELLQKQNSLARAQEVVKQLNSRQRIDATQVMTSAAEAALETRRADLARALTAVQNAQNRLQALINDPTLDLENVELIPTQPLNYSSQRVDAQAALTEAIQFRPEVAQSIKEVRAAAIRCNMAQHELLPMLNLVTQSYLSGLQGDNNLGRAWENQFTEGEPSYSVGLQYEIPIGNRAARARNQRRRLELRQVQNQYETTLQNIKLDVKVAAREVDTAQREMFAKRMAMYAQQRQLKSLNERFQLLPGEGESAALTLQNLLTAQERLAESESSFLRSQVTYNLSLMNLKKATGQLLQQEQVDVARSCVEGLPTHILGRTGTGTIPMGDSGE